MMITDILSRNVYMLRSPIGEEFEAHSFRMKLYEGGKLNLNEEIRYVYLYNRGEVEVESVEDLMLENGKYYLLIKWKGLQSTDNSWEPFEIIHELSEDKVVTFLTENKKHSEVIKLLDKKMIDNRFKTNKMSQSLS